MGIFKDPKAPETPAPKRKSLQADFSNLGPLKPGGTVGFLNFRDQKSSRKTKKADDEMDSDDDDTDNPILGKADDEEDKDSDRFLSPDDIKRQGELEEGVRKIRVSARSTDCFHRADLLTFPQLKRQHSAEPATGSAEISADTSASGTTPPVPERAATPPKTTASAETSEQQPQPTVSSEEGFLGSPLKKQRASVSMADENALRRRIAESSGRINEVLGPGTNENKSASTGSFGDKLDLDADSPAPATSQNQEEEL